MILNAQNKNFCSIWYKDPDTKKLYGAENIDPSKTTPLTFSSLEESLAYDIFLELKKLEIKPSERIDYESLLTPALKNLPTTRAKEAVKNKYIRPMQLYSHMGWTGLSHIIDPKLISQIKHCKT